MSEQSCTDPMVAQDNKQGEIELEPTQSAEVVLHKAEVSRSNVNHAPVVVSEVCAGGYYTGKTRSGGARGAAWVVGRPASGVPVGIAEGTSSHPLRRYVNFLCSSPLRLLCFPPMRSRSRS